MACFQNMLPFNIGFFFLSCIFFLEVTYLNMQNFICWLPFRSNTVLFPAASSLATHIAPSQNPLTFQEAQTSKQSLKIIIPPQDLIFFDSLSSSHPPRHFMLHLLFTLLCLFITSIASNGYTLSVLGTALKS